MLDKGYLAINGGILWTSCMTRPDVMFHTSHLAQFNKAPSNAALNSLLDVVAYLYCTKDVGITYGGNYADPPFEVEQAGIPEVWGDASFGGKAVHPYAGGFIRWKGAAILWIARKLKFVPLSTCEAEVAATVMMLKEAMFVLSVLHDLGYATEGKLPTLTDSKSGRDVIRNPGVTKHTAHFARWLHWARELYMQQKIEMILVEDSDMMADCDTKIVDRDKFFKCIKFQMNL